MSPKDLRSRFAAFDPSRYRATRFIDQLARFGVRQMIRQRAPQMAAALAYRTIFSLIPLLVLALISLRAFLGENGIRYGLNRAMDFTGISQLELAALPTAEDAGDGVAASQENGGASLSVYVEEFVNRTVERLQEINFGLITIVGVAVLVYAAFSLLMQAEQAFNTIYRAPSGRRLLVRLTNYWVLVTAGSIAMLVGFLISDRSSEMLATLPESYWWIVLPLNSLLKVALTWLILVCAYRLIPNARVALAPAAAGAAIAAVAWELCKSALGWFVGSMTDPTSSSQFAVYGSLALVPLFFLWIYVTWLLVLGGLEVAFALQMVSSGRASALERFEQRALIDPSIGIVLMRAAAERFEHGETCTVDELAQRTGLAEAVVERLISHLEKEGLLHRVERSADEDAFALAKPPQSLTAGAILSAMHRLAGGLSGPDTPEAKRDAALLDDIRRAEITALHLVNIHSPVGR